jgi:hypothetical protein
LTELHENEIASGQWTSEKRQLKSCTVKFTNKGNNKITELITSARKTLGSNSGKNQKEKQFLSKPWFDLDCKFARKNYRTFRISFIFD